MVWGFVVLTVSAVDVMLALTISKFRDIKFECVTVHLENLKE
jgi:hypothetical protein